MYRASAKEPRPPTVIRYRSYRIRPFYLLLACVFVAIALGTFCLVRFSRIACDGAECTAERWAIVGSFTHHVSVEEIRSVDVRARVGSKGRRYAEISVVRVNGPPIELARGSFMSVDPAKAHEVKSGLERHIARPEGHFETWVERGNVAAALMAMLFGFLGGAIIAEQIRQLRAIRLVVDHEREVLRLDRDEVPFDEIKDLQVDFGGALTWSSRRGEQVPGYRIVVHRKRGEDVYATRGYRAGSYEAHERARLDVLRALGRIT